MSPCPPPALGQNLQTRLGEYPDSTPCSFLLSPVPLTLWGDIRAYLSQWETHVWLVGGQGLSGCQGFPSDLIISMQSLSESQKRCLKLDQAILVHIWKKKWWTQPRVLSRSIMSRSTCCNKSTYLMPIRGWWAIFWALDIGFQLNPHCSPMC